MHQAKLKRQVRAAVLHAGVNAADVRRKEFAIPRGERLHRALRSLGDAENSLLLVVLQTRRAHHLSEMPEGEAPHHVHLPQAILRGHVALREKYVGQRGGVDGGKAARITNDRDFVLQSQNAQASIELGQSGTGNPIGAEQGSDDENHQREQKIRDPAGPAFRNRSRQGGRRHCFQSYIDRAPAGPDLADCRRSAYDPQVARHHAA